MSYHFSFHYIRRWFLAEPVHCVALAHGEGSRLSDLSLLLRRPTTGVRSGDPDRRTAPRHPLGSAVTTAAHAEAAPCGAAPSGARRPAPVTLLGLQREARRRSLRLGMEAAPTDGTSAWWCPRPRLMAHAAAPSICRRREARSSGGGPWRGCTGSTSSERRPPAWLLGATTPPAKEMGRPESAAGASLVASDAADRPWGPPPVSVSVMWIGDRSYCADFYPGLLSLIRSIDQALPNDGCPIWPICMCTGHQLPLLICTIATIFQHFSRLVT